MSRPAETACLLKLWHRSTAGECGTENTIPVQSGGAWVDRERYAEAAAHSWYTADDDHKPRRKDGLYLYEFLYPDADVMYENADVTDLRECNVLRLQRMGRRG